MPEFKLPTNRDAKTLCMSCSIKNRNIQLKVQEKKVMARYEVAGQEARDRRADMKWSGVAVDESVEERQIGETA